MMRNTLLTKIAFLALLVASAAVYGIPEDICDADFIRSVEDLQAQVMEIKSQYVSITSSLERIQSEIPQGLRNFSDLFCLEGQNIVVGPDGNIYYDNRDIRDYVSIMGSQSEDAGDGRDQLRAGYVTTEQFNQLSELVFALSATCQTLSANLATLQSTVNSISASQTSLQNSLQNLNSAYAQLNEQCESLSSAVQVNVDGSVIIAKSSPIVGNIEPRGNGYVYALAQNWDRCCSKFRVSTNTFLESITLYCDDPGKMPAPLDVYVQTVTQDNLTGQYVFETWSCVTVDTSNFPRCEWKFPPQYGKVPIQADRDYLLCIKKTNGALYPYLANSYRQGGFFKPIGASEALPPEEPEDPRSSSPGRNQETPRSNPSPQDWFDYLFLYDWEESVYSNSEIWSILKFSDDESFTFSETGLAVESGNITVAGSEVVTSSSLKDMFVSALTNSPNITWDMFCQELQNRIITTAGGSITDCLEVTQMKFNADADWEIGTTNICSDIVFLNENAKIRSNAGDLKLSAPEGEKISAESFLSFESGGQAGIITIPAEQTEKAVSCPGITDQAVIILTPRQPISNIWWSVRSIQSNVCFKVILDKTWNENLSFNYIIIRK